MTHASEHGEIRSDRTTALFLRMHPLPAGHPQRARLREELVQVNLPLVGRIARGFHHRGEPREDLEQVAVVGLLQAIDRYDVARGVTFSSFATPTILGEIKRYFRDHGWMVRVPRVLQERRLLLAQATPVLTQELGHAPTAAELAEHLDVETSEVEDALLATRAYSALSLDRPGGNGTDLPTVADGLGADEPAFALVDDRVSLRPLIEQLPERERRILRLRFFEDLTQSQIAHRLGVSQMHVSRLLTATLTTLREGLHEEGVTHVA